MIALIDFTSIFINIGETDQVGEESMVRERLQGSIQTGSIGGLRVDPQFLRVNQLGGTAHIPYNFFQGPSSGSDGVFTVSPGFIGFQPLGPKPPSSFLSPNYPEPEPEPENYPEVGSYPESGDQHVSQPGAGSPHSYQPVQDQHQYQPTQTEQDPPPSFGQLIPVQGPWRFPQNVQSPHSHSHTHTHRNSPVLWHRSYPQLANSYLPPAPGGFSSFRQPQRSFIHYSLGRR